MKGARLAGEGAVCAVIAALAVGWLLGWSVAFGGVPADPEPGYYWNLAVAAAVVAAPWVVAVRLLRRAWRAAAGGRWAEMDPPARVLAAAVATLPDDRRDWGAAMTAELTQVPGATARWRFAAGCARAAVFPPWANRTPALVVGALAAATTIVTGFAVGGVLPAMRVFAMTFVGLVGALAVLAVARSRRLVAPAPGPAVRAAGLACVAGCIAAIAYFLLHYPTAALHLSAAPAVFLAAILAGCLWLTLRPPRGLSMSPHQWGVAVGSAAAMAAGLVLVARLGIRGIGGWDAGVLNYMLWLPMAVLFAASALVAAVGRSMRAGVQAAMWTVLLTSLAFFAVGLLESVDWYRQETSLIFAGDGVPIHAVGENLRNFMWGLILFPFWWLPFGVIGAAVGEAGRLWRRPSFR